MILASGWKVAVVWVMPSADWVAVVWVWMPCDEWAARHVAVMDAPVCEQSTEQSNGHEAACDA